VLRDLPVKRVEFPAAENGSEHDDTRIALRIYAPH